MRKILFSLLVVVMLASIALAGCASQSGSGPEIFTIIAREPGSTTYSAYLPIASVVSKYSGMKVNLEPAGGLMDAFPMLQKQQVQLIGDASGNIMSLYFGKLYWEKERVPWIRLVLCGYTSPYMWGVRATSNINSWKDLEGKKLMIVSPTAQRSEVFTKAMMEKYGISKATLLPFAKFSDSVQQLNEGKVDVISYSGSASAWMDADRSPDGLRFLPITQEDVDFVNKKLGSERLYDLAPLPGGYLGMKAYAKPTNAFGDRNIAATGSNIPEESIYRFVKALYEHYNEFKDVYAPCADFNLGNALKAHVVPYHPGAIKYFKEAGIWTPQEDTLDKKLLESAK